MKLYLDVCCLNRPFDDQNQDRIHLESEAIMTILRRIETGHWTWLNSSVVLYEVNQIPNSERKHRILKMCSKAATVLKLNPEIYTIADCLHKLGFKSYDGLHLACAKQAKVDIFLTTDDKLLKKAKNNQDIIQLAVDNPLHWLQGVL